MDNTTYRHLYQTTSYNTLHKHHVVLREIYWTDQRNKNNNSTVTRENLLKLLARPVSVYISATVIASAGFGHRSSIGGISFSPLQLLNDDDDFSNHPKNFEPNSVENCTCTEGYSGTSCERCTKGFYRNGSDSFSDCIRCKCHNHTSNCNEDSGVCIDCQHNTFGDSCEFCLPGYYGNATTGFTDACQVCPCGTPNAETNLCKQSPISGNVTCLNCSKGYTGDLCNKCTDGFYRNSNGFCVTCECNNNSMQCDKTTGQCIDCGFNTTGNNCDVCKGGWFGNARNQTCEGMQVFLKK